MMDLTVCGFMSHICMSFLLDLQGNGIIVGLANCGVMFATTSSANAHG